MNWRFLSASFFPKQIIYHIENTGVALWLKRDNRRTTCSPTNNAITQMGNIIVTKLADKRIANNAGSVSSSAVKHDWRIWRWHNGSKFRLEFWMQLP